MGLWGKARKWFKRAGGKVEDWGKRLRPRIKDLARKRARYKAKAAPYKTAILAFGATALGGPALGGAVTAVGGEAGRFYGTMGARGEGYSGRDAREKGRNVRKKAYAGGLIGTGAGTVFAAAAPALGIGGTSALESGATGILGSEWLFGGEAVAAAPELSGALGVESVFTPGMALEPATSIQLASSTPSMDLAADVAGGAVIEATAEGSTPWWDTALGVAGGILETALPGAPPAPDKLPETEEDWQRWAEFGGGLRDDVFYNNPSYEDSVEGAEGGAGGIGMGPVLVGLGILLLASG